MTLLYIYLTRKARWREYIDFAGVCGVVRTWPFQRKCECICLVTIKSFRTFTVFAAALFVHDDLALGLVDVLSVIAKDFYLYQHRVHKKITSFGIASQTMTRRLSCFFPMFEMTNSINENLARHQDNCFSVACLEVNRFVRTCTSSFGNIAVTFAVCQPTDLSNHKRRPCWK